MNTTGEMANATEEDYPGLSLKHFWLWKVAAGMIILGGIMIQSFIVAVNVLDWLKSRSITSADQIITCLGTSRIISHIFCLPTRIPKLMPENLHLHFERLLEFIGNTSSVSSIWLSALLSIFFYFMISTSHNAFFLRLKTIISRKVVYLIIASTVLSLGQSVLIFLHVSGNNISTSFLLVGTVIPLLLFFVTAVPLVVSLGLHISRMQKCSNVNSTTYIYHRTIYFTVLSFLSCALWVILCLTIQYWAGHFGIFGTNVMYNIFPIMHSVLLIYASEKLRNRLFSIVCCAAGCLFLHKFSNNRVMVEVIPM